MQNYLNQMEPKKKPNDIKKPQNNIKPKKVDNSNKPKSNNNQNGSSNDSDKFVEVDGMKVKQKIIEHQKQVLKQIELDKQKKLQESQKQQQRNKKSNNIDNNDVNNISNGNHNKESPKKIQGGLDYSSEIEQLVGMGFDDRDKNLAAIIRAKGKVQIAVNILLQE